MSENWGVTAHQYDTRVAVRDGVDPATFSFTLVLSNSDKLAIYKRSEALQITCKWAAEQAILTGWDVVTPTPAYQGQKFGQDYTFTNFEEYWGWISGDTHAIEGIAWSRLLGISYAVMWDGDQGKAEGPDGFIHLGQSKTGRYSDFQFFYPYAGTQGVEVYKAKPDGTPLSYKLTIHTNTMPKQRVLVLDADRVVEFPATKLDICYGGTSRVDGIALISLGEEVMFKNLLQRAARCAGGTLTIPCSGAAEADDIDTALEDENGQVDVTSIDRLYYKRGTGGEKPEYITPDLKVAGEFNALFEITTKKLCRHMRMAQSVLDGEAQGIKASAKYDLMNSYAEVYTVQKHYSTPFEHLFYKLGLEDTRFVWRDPLEGVGTEDDFKMGVEMRDGTEGAPDSMAKDVLEGKLTKKGLLERAKEMFKRGKSKNGTQEGRDE